MALAVLGGCAGGDAPDAPAGEGSIAQAPRIAMHGMYRYMADAGTFTECLTNRTWPVAGAGQNAELEVGYLGSVGTAGEPMLVHLEGRIVAAPAMEGDSMVAALVVDRFLATEPGGECTPRYTTSANETAN
jgi:copper homeostasis protein (lipoprotein)